MAYKETQVRKIYGIERLGAKRLKDLQNGTHDETFFALVHYDMKISKACDYASYWETVRKNEVGSRVSFRDQIENWGRNEALGTRLIAGCLWLLRNIHDTKGARITFRSFI